MAFLAPALPFLMAGTQIASGIASKRAADRAAEAAREAGEFNATMIERDIDLLEKQRGILNAQFAIDDKRSRDAFERDVQGTVRASTGYAGFDMSQGTPMQVLRSNAREFEYQRSVEEFNNEVANMQISDAQEDARLRAELSRMEGGAQAEALGARGTASLISSTGGAATTAYETGIIGG
jgi:hypothetical protein